MLVMWQPHVTRDDSTSCTASNQRAQWHSLGTHRCCSKAAKIISILHHCLDFPLPYWGNQAEVILSCSDGWLSWKLHRWQHLPHLHCKSQNILNAAFDRSTSQLLYLRFSCGDIISENGHSHMYALKICIISRLLDFTRLSCNHKWVFWEIFLGKFEYSSTKFFSYL